MILRQRRVRDYVKPPSGLEQFAALDQLAQIHPGNANGLQITRTQHSQLARVVEDSFMVVLGHGTRITQCMQL